MPFERTSESLIVQLTKMNIQREHDLAQLLIAYQNQQRQPEHMADKTLLTRASAVLQEQLTSPVLHEEVIHLGVLLSHYIKDWETPRTFLLRYLQQPLSEDEEAWARWHLVDFLALSDNCEETIRSQQDLLQWALHRFPLDECLWVMNDGTQAFCWIQAKQTESWLSIFHNIMGRVAATSKNRFDRFSYLLTASHVLLVANEKTDEAWTLAETMSNLIQEDPTWKYNTQVHVESALIKIRAKLHLQQMEEVYSLASMVTHLLNEYKQTISREEDVELFCGMCHNTATLLYAGKLYDLAIPLFYRTIDAGRPIAFTYLWLAASLWATAGDRNEVLSLLRQAADMEGGGDIVTMYRLLPEFQDVYDDPQFQQASSGTTVG